MKQYKVIGHNRRSTQPVVMNVEASSINDAIVKMADKGVTVTGLFDENWNLVYEQR